MSLIGKKIKTPYGIMLAISSPSCLLLLEFEGRKNLEKQIERIKAYHGSGLEFKESSLLSQLERELKEYFEGKRKNFTLPLAFSGTEFQKTVWTQLQKIPFGSTLSYADLAEKVGNKKAFRAVALANSQNPLALVVPCHRVINKSGELGGYAGGLDLKKQLLRLEDESPKDLIPKEILRFPQDDIRTVPSF